LVVGVDRLDGLALGGPDEGLGLEAGHVGEGQVELQLDVAVLAGGPGAGHLARDVQPQGRPGAAPAVADGDGGVRLAAGLLEGDRLVGHLPGLDGQRRGVQVAARGQHLAEEPADSVLAGGAVVVHGVTPRGVVCGGTQRAMTGLALWSMAPCSEVPSMPTASGRMVPERASSTHWAKISPRGESRERLAASSRRPSTCSGAGAADASGAAVVPSEPAARSRAICPMASPTGLTRPCSSKRPRLYSTSGKSASSRLTSCENHQETPSRAGLPRGLRMLACAKVAASAAETQGVGAPISWSQIRRSAGAPRSRCHRAATSMR